MACRPLIPLVGRRVFGPKAHCHQHTRGLLRSLRFGTSSPQRAHSLLTAPSVPDVLVVGSGAAALTAALRAEHHNLTPLVIEKTSLIGGTTSYSGGGIWIPNSGLHSSPSDSFEEALKYMQNMIDSHPTRSSSLARKTAFLKNGPHMVQFLDEQGFEWQPSTGYPDYYPLVEGGKTSGRSIEGNIFDLNKLGVWKDKIRMPTWKPLYPLYTFEAGELFRSMSGDGMAFLTAAKIVGWRKHMQELLGKAPVTLGMSLVGQLLYLCSKKSVPIELDCRLKSLLKENGRVVGALVVKDGKEQVIEARKGVVLAAGGFSRNTQLRKLHQSSLGAAASSLASPGDMGDAITAAINIGAATELMNEAWWGPTVVDDTGKAYWTQYERALPHSIIVDSKGRRFLNEAGSYTRLIHNLFAHNSETGLGSPAYLILDSQHRDRYMLSGMKPGKIEQWALNSGLFCKADTLEGLAKRLDVDFCGLRDTVGRFNAFVSIGVDEDFHRGESPYDRFFGDPSYNNPNLGAIAKPPFYAARIVPGDLGTKGGILTDEYARALNQDGSVMEGLYAVGNSSASVMGREYIGSGSTLGPAMVFAYIGVNHIAKSR
jgi:succinate dehydrogenase/fumarate reductase flavoprotein subunit